MENVYQFLYCSCVYESSYSTISTHATLRGAYNAMKAHRLKSFTDWRKMKKFYRMRFLDTVHQDWRIEKVEVKG